MDGEYVRQTRCLQIWQVNFVEKSGIFIARTHSYYQWNVNVKFNNNEIQDFLVKKEAKCEMHGNLAIN